MKIASFIHPLRTFLPCSGVGRHINEVLLTLASKAQINLTLLFSNQWLEGGGLPVRCPLRNLPFVTFPGRENAVERLWKICRRPRMDSFIPEGADWVYCPMETRMPVSKCSVAITIHDIRALEPRLSWEGWLSHSRQYLKWAVWVRKAVHESRVIFTVSEYSKSRIIALTGAAPAKVVVSGNGISESFLCYEDSQESRCMRYIDAPYILLSGGLRPSKGSSWVLRVAAVVRDRFPEIRFVVAGGPNDARDVEVARALGNFVFTGWLADDALPPLTADAVALLFLSPYEGFGIPAAEAMAVATPPIVADRTSLPEVVGDAGFVVDPDKTEEIVDILIMLAKDSQERQRWGRLGMERARKFTWDRCADNVLSALERFS